MSRVIRQMRRVPGGWVAVVEVLNAYTDGSSRFDEVAVGEWQTEDEAISAVLDELDRDVPIAGVDLDQYRQLRAVTPEPFRALRLLVEGIKGEVSDGVVGRDVGA
jgi:hypothetical protein